jgi:fibronectin-binding autotransporter adhesin
MLTWFESAARALALGDNMIRPSIHIAAASALVLAAGVRADIIWTNPAGGLFSDGSNWSGGSPPGDFDTAVFNLPNTYTVNFGADPSLLNFAFRQGHVSFNAPNRMINLGSQFGPPGGIDVGLSSGDSAITTLMGGHTNLNGFGSHVNIGAASSTQGTLELRSGAQMTVAVGTINVGTGGTGSFLLADGSTLSDGGNSNNTFNLGAGGQVSVQSGSQFVFGTFNAAGPLTATGGSTVSAFQWAVSDTGSLTISDPGTLLQWDGSLSGNGLVRIQNGASAAPLGSTLSVTLGNLQVDGAGSSFSANNFQGTATVTNGGRLNPISIGSASGATNITVSGAGSDAGASSATNATILVTSGATAAGFQSLENSTLTVQGSGSRLNGGALNLPGDFGTHSSTITAQSGAVINATNQIRLSGGSRIDVLSGSQLSTPTLQIGNNLVPGTAVVNVSSDSSINVGAITIGTGSAPGRLIMDGTATLGAGGLTINSDGILTGSGLIMGGVTNSGHISQGPLTGILHIAGPFTQTAGGALDIRIGGLAPGSGYDQLSTIGAIVAGQLNVTLLPGFTPPLGSTYTIVQAEQMSGSFTTVALPTIESGLSFNVIYSFNSVTLVTVPAPSSAALLATGLLAMRRRRR